MPDHRQEDKLHTWEVVHEQGGIERTYRMCVPGGWLYRHVYSPSKGLPECMVFVPGMPTQSDNAKAPRIRDALAKEDRRGPPVSEADLIEKVDRARGLHPAASHLTLSWRGFRCPRP